MRSLEIQSPRPVRCLKRKVSQLDNGLDEGRANKRLNKWLEGLRSRSDTFLFSPSYRNRSIRPNRMPRSKTTMVPPPTPPSSGSGPQDFAQRPVSASFIGDASRPETPAQSFFEPSTIDPSTNGPVEDELKAAARTASPGYRDHLRNHGIHIDVFGGFKEAPAQVKSIATAILDGKRITPEPSANDLSQTQAKIARAVEKDEGGTRDAFISSGLFEAPENHLNKITTGSSVPFNRDGLPHTHGFAFTPVSTPKPDLQYSFLRAEFTVNQAGVMANNRIAPYAKPSSAGYWPFFMIELKAASRGGTHFVGENQAAGAGAHCVKSVETLFSFTQRERIEEKTFDSLVFSCVADAQHGTLWVHWRDSEANGELIYKSTELRDYAWKHDPKNLVDFRRAIRNIIDYGVNERLPEIKEALDVLVQQVPDWNLADRQARIRNLENGNEAGENQKKKKQIYGQV